MFLYCLCLVSLSVSLSFIVLSYFTHYFYESMQILVGICKKVVIAASKNQKASLNIIEYFIKIIIEFAGVKFSLKLSQNLKKEAVTIQRINSQNFSRNTRK
jgi:hypothetical protein